MPSMDVQPPEWIDSAPTVARSSITIDAPAADVWVHIADHETWPTWFTDLTSIERVGTGQGVGSGRKVKVGPLTIEEEFTAWDENEHFAFAVTKAPIPILKTLAESVQLESTGADSCTVVYRQGVEGRFGFLGPVMKRVGTSLEKQTGEALANLKRIVESGS